MIITPDNPSLTFALLKNGVNIRAKTMDDDPYNMKSKNRRNRLAWTKTLASGRTIMQITARSNTYMKYTENHDSLERNIMIKQSDM